MLDPRWEIILALDCECDDAMRSWALIIQSSRAYVSLANASCQNWHGLCKRLDTLLLLQDNHLFVVYLYCFEMKCKYSIVINSIRLFEDCVYALHDDASIHTGQGFGIPCLSIGKKILQISKHGVRFACSAWPICNKSSILPLIHTGIDAFRTYSNLQNYKQTIWQLLVSQRYIESNNQDEVVDNKNKKRLTVPNECSYTLLYTSSWFASGDMIPSHESSNTFVHVFRVGDEDDWRTDWGDVLSPDDALSDNGLLSWCLFGAWRSDIVDPVNVKHDSDLAIVEASDVPLFPSGLILM